MKRLMVMLLGLLLTTFSLPAVYACSGGYPPTLEDLLTDASLVVKARVLDADALGQTGVIEVIDYLAGTTENNILLLVQSDPIRTMALMEDRHGSGGCALTAPPLTPDEEAYFFLSRNLDGSYRTSLSPDSFNYNLLAYRFPKPDSTATIGSGQRGAASTPSTLAYKDVTEAGFRSAIRERTHSVPASSPSNTGTYPMPAPILVTTTSGASYLIPVDYSAPVQLDDEDLQSLRRSNSVWRTNNPLGVTGCDALGCTAYSPNGGDSLSVTPQGISYNGNTLSGEGFLFSSTNEAVAIWNKASLDFYTFRYPRLGLNEFQAALLASRPLNQGNQWIAKAAWSPDGRLFAYSDSSGLWLLDVYSQTPRLLLPASADTSVTVARYFSPGGRYLAITQGDKRSSLDLVTENMLPDGIFSPNERFLIAYDTTGALSSQSLCTVTSTSPCQDLGIGRNPHWIDSQQYLLMLCDPGQPNSCRVNLRSIDCCSGFYAEDVTTYDVEPVTGTYLVFHSSHELEIFDGYHYLKEDLDEWIGDEVIAAEWLPSLYYQSRTFSHTVVQRYHDLLASLPPV